MSTFADGGILASKSYVSGGNYINKMSNFCKQCYYDVKDITGPKACPFNALYWNFLQRNRERFKKNPRLSFMYATWDKFKQEKKDAIISRALNVLKEMADKTL